MAAMRALSRAMRALPTAMRALPHLPTPKNGLDRAQNNVSDQTRKRCTDRLPSPRQRGAPHPETCDHVACALPRAIAGGTRPLGGAAHSGVRGRPHTRESGLEVDLLSGFTRTRSSQSKNNSEESTERSLDVSHCCREGEKSANIRLAFLLDWTDCATSPSVRPVTNVIHAGTS